ncbi:MAG TPA: cytochrome c peroxidase, partial [Polyangiaceae bacterium]
RRAFADDRPVAIGATRGDRHTPRIALAALSPSQFWDGRARTLEEQAMGPIENAAEMGSSPAFVAARVASAHRSAFDSIFPSAQGDDEILADVAKAIATYERSLRVEPNALDAYAAGDFTALSFPEKQGLAAFARQGCMQCHWGPRLTDDAFHVTRTPTGRADGAPDVGRADHLGAFKTPSLRGVGHAKFFAHGGVIDSLDAMVESYGDGDANDARSVGVREPWIPRFGETTRWSIVKLARTL